MISRVEYVHNKSFIHRDIKVKTHCRGAFSFKLTTLAGQFPYGYRATLQQTLLDRFRSRKEVPRRANAATHSLPRGQESHWHSAIRLDQRPFGHRTVPTRRHGIDGLCSHVLQPILSALAGSQGRHETTEIRTSVLPFQKQNFFFRKEFPRRKCLRLSTFSPRDSPPSSPCIWTTAEVFGSKKRLITCTFDSSSG